MCRNLPVACSRLRGKKQNPGHFQFLMHMNWVRLCFKQHEIRHPNPRVLTALTAGKVMLWGMFCVARHETLGTDRSLTVLNGLWRCLPLGWHSYFLKGLYGTLEKLKLCQTGSRDIKTCLTLPKCSCKVMRIEFYWENFDSKAAKIVWVRKAEVAPTWCWSGVFKSIKTKRIKREYHGQTKDTLQSLIMITLR